MAYTTLRAKPCKQVAHTYQCGTGPAAPIIDGNSLPLSSLALGDTIRTGDFDVIVTEVLSGGNGTFTGVGYTEIPYLKNTKIAVEFKNASVNDCYEYTGGGTVQSAYDPSWFEESSPDSLDNDLRELLRNMLIEARYLVNNFDGSQQHRDRAKNLSDQIVSLQQQINGSNLSGAEKQQALNALPQLQSGLTGLANNECSPPTPLGVNVPITASARVAAGGTCAVDINASSDLLASAGFDVGAGLGAAITPEVAADQLAKFKLLDWSKSVVDATSLQAGSTVQLSATDLALYNQLVDDMNEASGEKIQIILFDSQYGYDPLLKDALAKGDLASFMPPVFENVKRIFIKINQVRQVISNDWGILSGCHEKAKAAVQSEEGWDFKLIGYSAKFIACLSEENVANYFANTNSEILFSAGVVNAVAEGLDIVEIRETFNNAAGQASQWLKDSWTYIQKGKVQKAVIEQLVKPLQKTYYGLQKYLVDRASIDFDNATNRFKTSPYFRGRVIGKLAMLLVPFADAAKGIKGSTETLNTLKGVLQRKTFTLRPSSSSGAIIVEEGNTSITIRQADELLTATSSGLSGDALSLGRFVKKIGSYEIYENGEVFYRAMTSKHYARLLKGEGVIGTGETFTSPPLEYLKADGGYGGIIVKFQMKPGTLNKLKTKALINDESDLMKTFFTNRLPRNVSEVNGWTNRDYILFKTESETTSPTTVIEHVNIGLRKGQALQSFNENILKFEVVE